MSQLGGVVSLDFLSYYAYQPRHGRHLYCTVVYVDIQLRHENRMML